ncbi:helix-turn-helix domain-containing protein [Streptomyces sp. NPDC050504]|uniref:helix-turn-helix domain-containing protein n=1 Tax=Streptomyces sp. NPDC050504 TaxID=3365618 RepID=UPI0037885E8A
MESGGSTLIGSVQRAMRLLDALTSEREATAKKLARITGVPLATTYHLLRTLVHEGYVERERGVFRLGPAAGALTGPGAVRGEGASRAHWLRSLGAELDAEAYCGVYENGEIRTVDHTDALAGPRKEEWTDFRPAGWAHALGRCLLGQLPPEARREYLGRYPMWALTPFPDADEDVVRGPVRTAHSPRQRAPEPSAECDGVPRETVCDGVPRETVCAAVPLLTGAVPAAVAVALPADEAERLPEVTARLRALLERHVVARLLPL